MFCHRQRRAFLVDSGADVSVFPASTAQRRSQPSSALQAANGTSIKTFGSRQVSLCLPGLNVVHRFILADVRKPILGSDFFRDHNLLIDIARCRLFRPQPNAEAAEASVVVKARPAHYVAGLCGLKCSPTSRLLQGDIHQAVDAAFADFPAVTSSSPVFDAAVPKHGVYHTVPTSGPPVFARARRLFGDKLDVAREEFRKMEEMGIIQPSNSPWASPLHVVPKADGGWSCLLYTSPSPRDLSTSRMPSSA